MTREWIVGRDPMRHAQLLACLAVFAFLYLPMVVTAVLSFNDNIVGTLPIMGFTTYWYAAALGDGDVLEAIRNSVVVAVCMLQLMIVVIRIAS